MMLAALLAASLTLPASAAQALPDCAALSRFWLEKARRELKPSWPAAELSCWKSESTLSPAEVRDIATARAAYMLHHTQWTDRATMGRPLVPGGGVSAPPASMLEWVGARLKKLVYETQGDAWAETADGSVHISAANFKLDEGFSLAGQLIHESRHLGHPAYGHVECTLPKQSGTNCDPTIAEDFDGGGSHAIATIWFAWIANRSRWSAETKKNAEKTAVWVLTNRINDKEGADLFACRYFGYYVYRKADCPGFR